MYMYKLQDYTIHRRQLLQREQLTRDQEMFWLQSHCWQLLPAQNVTARLHCYWPFIVIAGYVRKLAAAQDADNCSVGAVVRETASFDWC